MSATSTFVVMACDICNDEMHETKTGMVCWPCSNFIPTDQLWRYDAQIHELKTRGWHDLDEGEREDAIHSAQMWLRGDFALLLPCDISDACRSKIIGEAENLELRRDHLRQQIKY